MGGGDFYASVWEQVYFPGGEFVVYFVLEDGLFAFGKVFFGVLFDQFEGFVCVHVAGDGVVSDELGAVVRHLLVEADDFGGGGVFDEALACGFLEVFVEDDAVDGVAFSHLVGGVGYFLEE